MTEVAGVGRRERKKEETKRRIFESALQLFNEKGFDATTIDDITQRADVAKGTFFNYFPRKESVLEYLAEEWLDVAEKTAVDRSQSATSRIRALYHVLSTAYAEYPDLTRAVMRASATRMCCPEPDGAWQRFERLLTQVLEEGQQSGELRTDVKSTVLHGVLISCFVGGTMWWLGEGGEADVTLEHVVASLQGVALDGMKVSGR